MCANPGLVVFREQTDFLSRLTRFFLFGHPSKLIHNVKFQGATKTANHVANHTKYLSGGASNFVRIDRK